MVNALAAVLAGLVLIAPGTARADRRIFDFTYTYATQPEAGVELEVYNTQALIRPGDGSSTSTWQHLAQVEYGITDRTDLALAQVFEQTGFEGARYAATRLRGRHRFAERGDWPVDIVVIAEVGKLFSRSAYELEPRIVLSRDFSGLVVAANLIGRIEIDRTREGSGELRHEAHFVPGWSAGASVTLSSLFNGGFETWGWIRDPSGDRTVEAWGGTAVSLRPSTKLWFTVGAGLGLTDASADFVFRFIVSLSI